VRNDALAEILELYSLETALRPVDRGKLPVGGVVRSTDVGGEDDCGHSVGRSGGWGY
jgi:hypothetical protein